jgi:hypothetical protein
MEHVHIQAYENELVGAGRLGILRKRMRDFTNVSMRNRQLSVSVPALHQPIVYLTT